MALAVNDEPNDDLVKVCVNWADDKGCLRTTVKVIRRIDLEGLEALLNNAQVL